jgi:predicted dehydrogenase
MKRNHFSRRQFLQTGVGATGALLAARTVMLDPQPLEAYQQNVAASDRLRLGIIGVGMQGAPLLTNAVTLPGVECVAACDLYDGRHTLAKEITNNPNLPTTRRYQELLANKDIDCLIAAVPDHWHKQVVVDAVNAGKDIYCEKPMSHSPAEGFEMAAAQQKTGRIVQIGSQRVSSVIYAKAKELVSKGAIGDLCMVEGSLGRNDPTGAWEYPPPTDLSPQTLDWDTWQGNAPKKPFDKLAFARWRCWKEYGTGVAGDLLVHLISGMMYALNWNQPPTRAMAMGGILRWKDGRNMPDVHTSMFQYGDIPVVMRLNLGTESPEVLRIMGSKGYLEIGEFSLTHYPQPGVDTSPSYYAQSFPRAMREEYLKQWHEQNDPKPGQEPLMEAATFKGPSYDDVKPHLWTFFQAVRSRKPVTEDAVFGNHAALACHMANESYFRKSAVYLDPASKTIKNQA